MYTQYGVVAAWAGNSHVSSLWNTVVILFLINTTQNYVVLETVIWRKNIFKDTIMQSQLYKQLTHFNKHCYFQKHLKIILHIPKSAYHFFSITWPLPESFREAKHWHRGIHGGHNEKHPQIILHTLQMCFAAVCWRTHNWLPRPCWFQLELLAPVMESSNN
jgi:hypothetical protein